MATAYVNAETYQPFYAPIDSDTAGNYVVIVNQLSPQRIVVEDWLANVAGAQTVQWKDSNGAELTGPMTVAAAGNSVGQTANTRGHFATGRGANALLVLGESVQTSGSVTYHYEP